MREFSKEEQRIIHKIVTIHEVKFNQLFSERFLQEGRLEIDAKGRIEIYCSDPKLWTEMILELNTVVNLIAYLLNNRLMYAYSNTVKLTEPDSAILGNHKKNGPSFMTVPYNHKRLARITIRHQSNLFQPYQPLRTLHDDKFVLKADKMHRQMHIVTWAAVLVAFAAATVSIISDHTERSKEFENLSTRINQLNHRLDLLQTNAFLQPIDSIRGKQNTLDTVSQQHQ